MASNCSAVFSPNGRFRKSANQRDNCGFEFIVVVQWFIRCVCAGQLDSQTYHNPIIVRGLRYFGESADRNAGGHLSDIRIGIADNHIAPCHVTAPPVAATFINQHATLPGMLLFAGVDIASAMLTDGLSVVISNAYGT